MSLKQPTLFQHLSFLILVALLTLMGGCEPARRTSLTTPNTPTAGAQGPVGGVEVNEGGVEAPSPLTLSARAPRRLSVAQLARSIEVLTGGVRWVEDLGQGPVDMLTLLAPTLGVADFRNITHESLEPSLLMSKFVQDGAQRVCAAWVRQEREPATRTGSLVKSPEGTPWGSLEPEHVRANLSRLLVRFFAYSPQPSDDPRVEALYELFSMVAESAPSEPAADAWGAVCLALMTDPEFLMY